MVKGLMDVTETEEEYSFVAGTVLGENFEIRENQFEMYEKLAEYEQMSVDEFVDNLDEYAILSSAAVSAREEILSWESSGETLPPRDQIDALHTEIIDANSQVSEYPYDVFSAWLPGYLEYVQDVLIRLLSLWESLEELRELETKLNLSEGDSVNEDVQSAKENLYEARQSFIVLLQETTEGFPIPESSDEDETQVCS